ncbi:Uncharacterised protein [Streptococcus pneumoniae]|nr:Uncharacterised protein [Streptococcus pneumoniae]
MLSVISKIKRFAGNPVLLKMLRTDKIKRFCINCCMDKFTDNFSPSSYSGNVLNKRHDFSNTQSPNFIISPDSSATGINSPGEIGPSSVEQRAKASIPVYFFVFKSIIGCSATSNSSSRIAFCKANSIFILRFIFARNSSVKKHAAFLPCSFALYIAKSEFFNRVSTSCPS